MNVAPYIGLPFVEKGRDRTGLDCWGLVRLIYQEQLGIDLPSYLDLYPTVHDGLAIESAITAKAGAWTHMALADAIPGDVLLIRIEGHRWHVGVLFEAGRFIHADLQSGVVAERVDSAVWAKRIIGAYRHPAHHQPAPTVRLVACQRPLSVERDRLDVMVPPGRTIADHIRISMQMEPDRMFARVYLDGQPVEHAAWEYTVPKPGQGFVVRVIPMGGDGGGKMAVRIVAMLAVVVAAAYTGGAAASALGPSGSGILSAGAASAVGSGIQAGITIASMLAINGHIPPPLPRLTHIPQSNQETT